MVKRYDEVNRYAQGETRSYVLASDFDRMRRRLVVKLLRERRRRLLAAAKVCDAHGLGAKKAERLDDWNDFYRGIALTIELGEPLEYFRKLGSEK